MPGTSPGMTTIGTMTTESSRRLRAFLRVVAALRGEHFLEVALRPIAQRIDRGGERRAERRDRIFNRDRNGRDRLAADQAVALERLQHLAQHLLRDAFNGAA